MATGRFPFFRRPRRSRPPAGSPAGTDLRLFLHGRGTYPFDVIGLVPLMTELQAAAAAGVWLGERQDCLARIVCADGTPLARNTVAIEIGGRMLGYCPPYLAAQYREWLLKWRFSAAHVYCNAVIVGRRGSPGERLAAIGIKLDIELPFKATTLL